MLKRAPLDLLKGKKNIIGIEVGVERGGNAFDILQNLDVETLYLVDPFSFVYDNTGNLIEDPQKANDIEKEARLLLEPFSDKIVWIKGLSCDVADQLPDNVDFVYLDGSHEYRAVKTDIDLYYPKIKDGGILAGHDFNNLEVQKAVIESLTCLRYDGFDSSQSRDCRATDWWILKDTLWTAKVRNPNYKKHITFHGSQTFRHKSHSHLQAGFSTALVNLGYKVTHCLPYDLEEANGLDKQHLRLRQLVSTTHISTEYNLWAPPGGLTDVDAYDTSKKFNCLIYNDGHFTQTKEEVEKINKVPFNYLVRSGKDAAITLGKQLNKPVYYMYDNGVDRSLFHPNVKPSFDFKGDFVFMLTSQNLWNWDLRGTDLALAAFLDEFKEGEKVRLLLKIGSDHEVIKDTSKFHPLVTFLPGVISLEGMATLYKSANCMLSPIRGSLWESPVLQAMSCGIPAIATNAGGPQTYIKDGETGILLDYEWRYADKGDTKTIMYPGEIWKAPNKLQLQSAMRFAFEHQQFIKELGNNAAEDVKMYTYKYLAEKLIEFFDGSKEFVVELDKI